MDGSSICRFSDKVVVACKNLQDTKQLCQANLSTVIYAADLAMLMSSYRVCFDDKKDQITPIFGR